MSKERELKTEETANLVDLVARSAEEKGVVLLMNDDVNYPVFAYAVGGYSAQQAAVVLTMAAMSLFAQLDEADALKAAADALNRYIEANGG